MVKVGDTIQVGRSRGIVEGLYKGVDGRYIILYKKGKRTEILIEGDEEFRVIE